MKNNKGIAMVTLIVTIIVMLILVGLAYSTGVRYINKSKQEERDGLRAIMSGAVERRQNDNYIGLGISGETSLTNNTYVGYHVGKDDFEKLAGFFDSTDDVYEPQLWYVLDAKCAEELGIVDADKYLVPDLQDTDGDNDGKYIALVDYYTGRVILLDLEEISKEIVIAEIVKPDGDHIHRGTVATCTEASVCSICGEEISPALGHKFNPPNATCTEDAKCERCGFIGERALGHDFDTSVWAFDANGHFHACRRCGAKSNFEKHDRTVIQKAGTVEAKKDEKGKLIKPEFKHNVSCSKCDYNGDEECYFELIDANDTYCVWRCIDCDKESEHIAHSIKYLEKNKELHTPYCEYCNHQFPDEAHIDGIKPFGRCDKCNAILDTSAKPAIKSVTMEKVMAEDTVDDKYLANNNDTVVITIETTVALAATPTIKVQNMVIRNEDIKQDENDATKWIVTVVLNEYTSNDDSNSLVDGDLTIEISNIRSAFGVKGDDVTETTDGKYVDFDKTLPKYEYLP